MGRQWNPDGVPNDLLIPKGTFHFEVGEIEEAEINGKLVYKPDLTVVEPKAYKGKKLFGVTYWIGTDDDKDARDPETWAASRGAVDLKKLIVAAGVKPSGDMDKDREAATGRVVGITVGKKARKTDESRVDNTAQDYWKAGTRALEVFDDDGVPAKAGWEPASRKPESKFVQATPLGQTKAKVAVAPPVVDEDEEEEVEEATPAPVKSTEALPKPGKPKKPDMKACPKCGKDFARNVLLDHMAACVDEGDDEDDD